MMLCVQENQDLHVPGILDTMFLRNSPAAIPGRALSHAAVETFLVN